MRLVIVLSGGEFGLRAYHKTVILSSTVILSAAKDLPEF
jgi:hypothetical protein